MIIARYDVILDQSVDALLYNHLSNYTNAGYYIFHFFSCIQIHPIGSPKIWRDLQKYLQCYMYICTLPNIKMQIICIIYIIWAAKIKFFLPISGLRISVLVTSSMLLAGKVIQVIPFRNVTLRTVVIYLGHLIAMLPSFIANGAPPLVSNTWFPPNERTTATAIGALAANFGAALAFFIGPSMIPKINGCSENSEVNLTDKNVHLIETRIMDYFYVQIGLAAFLFLCVIIYFPSKPPLPPSIAALTRKTTEISYKDGLRMLLHNRSYWLLVLVFATSFGIYFGWTSVLDLAVQPFDIDERTSGWLGTGGSLAGIISGIIIAR